MEIFDANVQYNDWKGTAALDDADLKDIRKFMQERGLLNDDEFLIGMKLWLGELHGDEIERPFVHAFVINAQDFEAAKRTLDTTADPLPLKKVEVDLSMDEFLLLFKRFAISVSWSGLDVSGREYIT